MKRWMPLIITFLVLALQSAGPAFAQQDAESPKASGGEDESDDSGTEGEDEAPEEEKAKKGFWVKLKDPQDGMFDVTASGEGGSGLLPLVMWESVPSILVVA